MKFTLLTSFSADARHAQILCLASFLLYGILALDWQVDVAKYVVLIGVSLLVQAIGTYWVKGDYGSWRSALISALGLCLLFKSDSLWVCALGALLTIGSKFVLRLNGKHLFNPTNFGIVVTILLTGAAYISPGQWGNGFMIMAFLALAGTQILFKVNRLETGFVFLSTFLAMEFVRNVLWLGWAFDFWGHQFTSGTLLLFSFFMITDPVTTPSHRVARVVWAVLVAMVSYYLLHKQYVYAAPLWALFICSPLTPLFDRLWKGQLFRWRKDALSA